MKRKVIRLDEARLRALISEMFDVEPDDDWHRLDNAMAAAKRSVQGLQGTLAAERQGVPGNAKQAAARAKGAVEQLLAVINGIAAG